MRNILPRQMQHLAAAGRAALATKSPLHLNSWRAPEVLSGPPFGDTALLDPILELRSRQLHWLQLLGNLPGMVGVVH